MVTRRSSTVSKAETFPSQAEATTVIICGALPFMPQFLRLSKKTIENLNISVRSRIKHTENFPTGLLSFKNSTSPVRWHKSDDLTMRRPNEEYIPLADVPCVSLHTNDETQNLNAKGDERRFDGPQTSDIGAAELGSGIVKSIRIETKEDSRRS